MRWSYGARRIRELSRRNRVCELAFEEGHFIQLGCGCAEINRTLLLSQSKSGLNPSEAGAVAEGSTFANIQLVAEAQIRMGIAGLTVATSASPQLSLGGGTFMFIRSIAYLRGLAALAVLLYHAAHYSSVKTGWALPREIFGNQWGLYGVTIFFIISGFLMSQMIEVRSSAQFLVDRFLRIYPMFLIAALIAAILHYVGTGDFRDFKAYQFVLLPLGRGERILNVEWTLCYEIFYYLLVAPFCHPALRRYFSAFMAAWLAVLLVAWFGFQQFGTSHTPKIALAIFSIWNMGFVVGALLGSLSLSRFSNGYVAFAGLIVLLCSEFHGNYSRHVLIPVGLAMILSWLLKREAEQGIVHSKPLETLGDWSYGIYLIHVPTILLVISLLDNPKSSAILLSTAIGCALLTGSLAGQLDVRLHRFLRSVVRRRRYPSEAAAEQPVSSTLLPGPLEAGGRG